MTNDLVLFDLDGTLTEPRRKFDNERLRKALHTLSNYAAIGIVSGSDFNFIDEQFISQLHAKEDINVIDYVLPCNGTKLYINTGEKINNNNCMHNVSMRKELSNKTYRKIIEQLCKFQVEFNESYDCIITGNFINYRESMINWCPIGRGSTQDERSQFVEYDNNNNIRTDILNNLLLPWVQMNDINITITLGGQTSFDIYPYGWDKSYALRHFKGKTIWFVGDKCTGFGNDKAIYDCIAKAYRFETTGPEQTTELIDMISRLLKIK